MFEILHVQCWIVLLSNIEYICYNIGLYFTTVLEIFDPMLECIKTNIGNSLTNVGLCWPMLQTFPVVGVCRYHTLEMFHPVLNNSLLQLLNQFSNIGLHNSPILENYLSMLECRATNAGNDLPVLVNFVVLCWKLVYDRTTLGDITIYQCRKTCHVYQ